MTNRLLMENFMQAIFKRWGIISSIVATVFFGLSAGTAMAAPSGGLLIAMGDSVSAGLGLDPLASATGFDQSCGRSSQAYPMLVAAAHNLQLANVSCSGARVFDGLLTDQERAMDTVPAQLRQARDAGRPTAVTMTIMANDVYWTQWLAYCRYGNCGSASDTATFNFLLAKSRAELWGAMAYTQSLGPDHIYSTGYYDPFGSDTSCFESKGFTASEISWLRARLSDLNHSIANVDRWFPRATFVPIQFGDRGFCSPDSLIQGPDDPAPFHPTAAGQRKIAQAINKAWR